MSVSVCICHTEMLLIFLLPLSNSFLFLLFSALIAIIVLVYFLKKTSQVKNHFELLYISSQKDKERLEEAIAKNSRANILDENVTFESESNENLASSQSNHGESLDESDSDWLRKVQFIFNQNMDNSQYSVELLANEVGLSKRHFQRKIKELTGHSPIVYLKELRLEKARIIYIENNQISLKQLAKLVGYRDEKYFAKLFKEKFQITY